VQVCEWTGDCPVEGCQNKCQAQAAVGVMFHALEDRAWDLDWWQLCPDLAQTVHLFNRELAAKDDAPSPAGNDSGEVHSLSMQQNHLKYCEASNSLFHNIR
jgi:hypothetical protein